MANDVFSAFGAIGALRDQIEARLNQNEDYRALKALEAALREVAGPGLPKTGSFPATFRKVEGMTMAEAARLHGLQGEPAPADANAQARPPESAAG